MRENFLGMLGIGSQSRGAKGLALATPLVPAVRQRKVAQEASPEKQPSFFPTGALGVNAENREFRHGYYINPNPTCALTTPPVPPPPSAAERAEREALDRAACELLSHDLAKYVAIVKNVPLFSEMGLAELEAAAKALQLRHFKARARRTARHGTARHGTARHGTARHAWRVHALWSHRPRLKGVRRRGVDRHADAAGLGVAAPWRLEQVIHALAHVDVQPREGVREDDLVEHTRERADLLGVHVLDQARPLLKPALRTVGGERGATAAEDGRVGAGARGLRGLQELGL